MQHTLTVHKALAGLGKDYQTEDLLHYYQNKITDDNKRNDKINAVIALFSEYALEKCSRKSTGALAGIPIAVKDNMLIKGLPLACASRILQGYVASYTAGSLINLEKNGAIFFGRTNMDEFAMGSSTENSCYGPARNPHDRSRICGGSSGGSAAAVAADQALCALGSDTGGSIRQPAAMCGVVGLKPTYGRVSRSGLVAFGSSLDQIGPITRTVYDAALLLNSLAGHDPKDSTSMNCPVPDYTMNIEKKIRGMTFALPSEYFSSDLNKDMAAILDEVIAFYKKLGCSFIEISMPHLKHAIEIYYIIAAAEASANLARFDGIRYGRRKNGQNLLETYLATRSSGFGEEVKRRILLGTYVLSSGYYDAYYLKALKARRLIKEDFMTAFKKADFIMAPVSPCTAFKIGEKTDNPLEMYLSDIYTTPVNLAGLPAISVPGAKINNLPASFQLIGKYFDEPGLLQAAHQYDLEHSSYEI